MDKVSLIKCNSYDTQEVFEAVKKAIDLIGGIKVYVKPGEKILLKPNLLSARNPERAVTTHPEVVRAVIKLVKEAGAIPFVGDSPGGAVRGIDRVWDETEMRKITEEEKTKMVNFENSGSVEMKINHTLIPSVHIAKAVLEADGIINLPKLKTHNVMIYTGAIKNLYGCVPGLRKAEYHKLAPHPDEFSHMLDEIYLLLKNKLRFSLIDGIWGMEGNGPSSGEKRKLNMIIASRDAIALDTAATKILGLQPKKIESIHYLAKDNKYSENMDIVGDNASEFDVKKFKFPSNWYINLVPRWFIKIVGRFIWLKPMIVTERCMNCMLCVDSCPVKTIEKKGNEKPVVAWKGCISCLCCHELCPYNAIELKRSLLAKLIIRR